MSASQNSTGSKIFVAFISLLLTTSTSASAWAVSSILDLKDRTTQLEAKQVTSTEITSIRGDISLIRETMARMDERNKQSDQRDAEIKDRLDDLVTLVVNIDQRLIRLETVIGQPK